ncbi:MAG: GntR family transcriptional regulator [Muribaculaceae bacterium]|jgi:predicted RNA-binding protein (virulence factor B family)|uniref:CvfB family protein n=3 Tax=Duncaniella TaxID=2518495 RepID=UPI000E9F17EB|nr:S1-like domain-containing RNA-binding protein [Duncaniella dubosii]MBJ2190108.1 GntR family transcriptional regulator [Muribaculaceae bacterium]MCX4284088.1 S1-like domain-containing RNA-binding protein [Duncaniella dubosii]ROS87881.1 GntR family transcriptional regulator [Muribaculaceae bacterium Isolate-080 (Janvier)]HBN63118.1 GntR family transcriptional regulator [Porphyromonadaceae bacterium]
MLKIGKYNSLQVARNVDFGAYLADRDGNEVLLPARYISMPLQPGDEMEVFVYKDSEDRPVATTERPFAEVGEFAYLQVTQVNNTGAFLDWGLIGKELLVPYSEQKMKLTRGMVVLVYVYLDNASQRVVASAKIEKFIGNRFPHYRLGEKVEALVYKRTELGYKAIVNNLFHGMVYENELYAPLEIGKVIPAYVKQVRDDGKIDLVLSGGDDGRVDALMDKIVRRLEDQPECFLPISDSASPETIRATFQCSKKDFKKAIGHLYRQRKILITDGGIRLVV